LQRFRFVKAVDYIGNFKTDIDVDYEFSGTFVRNANKITLKLNSSQLETDLPQKYLDL